jgi:toxin ParE1/3/4
MSPTLDLTIDAQADFNDGFDFYERKLPRLGDDFDLKVREALSRIVRFPKRGQKVFGEVRAARVNRFPYVIYYIAEEDRIVVYAVFHAKRDPAVWQKRIPLSPN